MNQLYAPPLSRLNKILLIVTGALFLANAILGQALNTSLVSLLGLSHAGVFQGFIFQFVTFPFIETNFMSFLFNGLLLWFIGSELESHWGEKFYKKFLALTVLVTGALFFLASFAFPSMSKVYLSGLDGMNFALLVAYALIFSERQLTFMLLFPMKAKYFCLILAGIEAYMAIFSGQKYSAWAHLTAMAFAYVYLRGSSLKARAQNAQKQRRKDKMRSKLHIVKDDDPTTWH